MDFITAMACLISIAALWICNIILKKEYDKLWGNVDNLEEEMEILKEKVEIWKDTQGEQRCQHCRSRETCPAYDTGVSYPCKYFDEEYIYDKKEA